MKEKVKKTVDSKGKFVEGIKYYFYMFVLIVLLFLIIGILGALNT